MVKQAVVVVHGMGEQRPLDTLTRFVDVALAPGPKGGQKYYSRPESVTGSFESRRFLAPFAREVIGEEELLRPQTEVFEYHWADKMQGNRLDDLWPTCRRMLLCWPWRVPAGLRGLWGVAWALVVGLGWAVGFGPLRDVWREGDGLVAGVIGALVSSAAVAALLSYLVSRVLPRWLTTSFVDVVRYLDTSPRSYGVRREIRKGLVEMLQALHAPDATGSQTYDRVVLVAHSLGGYIAYDAIAHLWGLTSSTTTKGAPPTLVGRAELEQAAHALADGGSAAAYQDAQGVLFDGLRASGNPWLITDLVTVGTPMCFADMLLPGKGRLGFAERKKRYELPTCPPLEEGRRGSPTKVAPRYSWFKHGRSEVLHEGAPFAVVRWTNLYFPTWHGITGDWFGGPLCPLFGPGIRDVPVRGNRPQRWLPALAHSLYFRYPGDLRPDSVTTALGEAMRLSRRRVRPAARRAGGAAPRETPRSS